MPLDAGLLDVGWSRLLLRRGPGCRCRGGCAVDTGLLGIRGRGLRIPLRVIGVPTLATTGALTTVTAILASGFAGGRWVGNSFAYNRTVSNVDPTVIHSTYSETVANNATLYKPSYNGGPGGTTATPTAQERLAAADPHVPSTPPQRQSMQQAAKNPALLPQANPGQHATVVIQPPAVFHPPATAAAYTAAPPATHYDHSRVSSSSTAHVAARQSAAPKSAAAATKTQHPSSKASGKANDSQPREPEARPTH